MSNYGSVLYYSKSGVASGFLIFLVDEQAQKGLVEKTREDLMDREVDPRTIGHDFKGVHFEADDDFGLDLADEIAHFWSNASASDVLSAYRQFTQGCDGWVLEEAQIMDGLVGD